MSRRINLIDRKQTGTVLVDLHEEHVYNCSILHNKPEVGIDKDLFKLFASTFYSEVVTHNSNLLTNLKHEIYQKHHA